MSTLSYMFSTVIPTGWRFITFQWLEIHNFIKEANFIFAPSLYKKS